MNRIRTTIAQTFRAVTRLRHWGLYRVGLLVLLGLAMLANLDWAIHYPDQLIRESNLAGLQGNQRMVRKHGERVVSVESFAARCAERLPPDARILFHGDINGLVLAYELFPRTMFMLPSDWQRLTNDWHHNWDWLELKHDPLIAYWRRPVSSGEVDRARFIRQHHITHEVFFDASDPAACYWKVAR